MAKVSYGMACLAAIALTVSVSAKELQTIGNGTFVPAIKAMAVTMNPDGTVTPKGDWVMLNNQGGGTGTAASSLNLFDAFENDGTACPGPAAPAGGDACGLPGPGYRWFFGPSYHNPFTVAENDADGGGGVNGDRAEFGWYWYCSGSGTEDCYVAIFTGDTHDNTCGGAYNLIDGVVFGFGVLNCNPGGYYYTDVCDLIGQGVPLTTYSDGVDGGVLAQAFDGQTLTLCTGGQFMLWGENAGTGDLAGEHDDISYDDDAPADGQHGSGECYSYGFGICPDPLHHMVGIEGAAQTCASDGCNGGEKLKARAKDKNGQCQVKGTVTNGSPGSVYGIVLPSGDCTQKAANSNGKASAKERPSSSGTVSVPTCGLSKAVTCP